jgi:hypothetical protein
MEHTMKLILRSTIIACSLAMTGAAWAQTANSDSSYLQRTAPQFESFAGSRDNYNSLATGLRSGRQITLTSPTEKAVFVAPTKPMGYGNVTRTLDLAQRQLAAQGITNPTPSQLQAALMGGTITTSQGTVVYRGVAQMRADGMGWGQIAHSVGVHPGMGKSASAAVPASAGITTAAGGRSSVAVAKSNRPETAGATGRGQGQARIATASGNGGGNSAAAHANARGLGNSASITSAAGAHAGGMNAGGMGGGHGNAGGGGGGGRGK